MSKPPNYRELTPDCCETCKWGDEGRIADDQHGDYVCYKHGDKYGGYVVHQLGLCDDYQPCDWVEEMRAKEKAGD
jgi:hypothetical protein